jgi:hypothetical protein
VALNDLMLKAKVNLALARDSRVSSFDVGVQAEDGRVTLTGDVDTPDECRAAEEIARTVEGVKAIDCQLTCGVGAKQDTAELVSQRFLEKLDEEWDNLPENTALAQADYLKWALWMIYKFRIPDAGDLSEVAEAQARTTDEAIKAVASRVNGSPAMIAIELQRIADEAETGSTAEGPTLHHSDLVTTPLLDEGNTELAA